MKKTIILLYIAICSLCHLHAQQKFGKITPNDFTSPAETADTTADAIYIYNIGETTFKYLADHAILSTKVRVRMRILTEKGRDYANQAVVINSSAKKANAENDQVRNISAMSYNLENGQVTKTEMQRKYVNQETVDERTCRIKFAIPDVKVGSIIEYQYTIDSPRYTYLPSWYLQANEPVAYSYYDVTFPEWFLYNVESRGECKFNLTKANATVHLNVNGKAYNIDGVRYIIEGYDLPSLKNEKYVWCTNDYATRLDFELQGVQIPGELYKNYTNSWDDVREFLSVSADYKSFLKIKNPLVEEMQSMSLEGMTVPDKASKLFTLLQSKMKWNKNYSITCDSPLKAYKNGQGSNAEMNFIYMSMLRDAGIKCTPLLLRLRNRGRLPITHPSIDKLSTFVVAITDDSGSLYFADGSAEHGDINVLPRQLLTEGVPFDAKFTTDNILNLADLTGTSVTQLIQGIISPDGKFAGSRRVTFTGVNALGVKDAYHNAEDSIAFVNKIEESEGIRVKSLWMKGINGTGRSVIMQNAFEKQFTLTGNMLYVNPMVIRDVSSNPFTNAQRSLPVQFPFLETRKYIVEFTVPDDYTIESLPENASYTLGNDCEVQIQVASNGNTIKTQYVFITGNTFIEVSRYKELQDFWQHVMDVNSKKIILKKK